jgi:hypothetical protein
VLWVSNSKLEMGVATPCQVCETRILSDSDAYTWPDAAEKVTSVAMQVKDGRARRDD